MGIRLLSKRIAKGLPWLLPLAAFCGVFFLPFPHSANLFRATVVGSSVLAAAFIASSKWPARWKDITRLTGTLVVFAIPLLFLWQTGRSTPALIGGLLPWSDASNYYHDARRLLEGAPLSAFSARRPLFAGYLAAILGVTGQNLQVTLMILVGVVAIACFLLAREIDRSHGAVAGAAALVLLYLFYRRFCGTTLTENLGLSLGALGLAVLWRSRERRVAVAALGIFLLTLAQNARAGAFLVIPALVLAGVLLAPPGKRIRSAALLIGSAALAFALNFGILKALAGTAEGAFSNWSYTLYGQAVGGTSWQQAGIDHPEINALEEGERSRAVYRLAWQAIRKRPSGLAMGAVNAWRKFLSDPMIGAFGFVWVELVQPITWLIVCLWALTLAGLWAACFSRVNGRNWPLLLGAIGIVLSVPLVPPLDADCMRVYAATIPIVAAILGLGAGWLWDLVTRRARSGGAGSARILNAAGIAGIALCGFVVLGALLVRVSARSAALPPPSCPAGGVSMVVRMAPGSTVRIVPDSSARRTRMPVVRVSDFRQGLNSFWDPEIRDYLAGLNGGVAIRNTFDLRDGRYIWAVGEEETVARSASVGVLCGEPVEESQPLAYGFFRVRSAGALTAP